MKLNNDNGDKEARGGAILVLAIGAATFIVVALIVAFLVKAGFINLQ